MSIQDAFKKSFLTNFSVADISTYDIVITMMVTLYSPVNSLMYYVIYYIHKSLHNTP